VSEYWLIDPQRRVAEFFVRGAEGTYHAAAVENGLYTSTILTGLRLRVDWLWEDPLPMLANVLKELRLI
jgi:Uma2 family endonuclease